MQILKKPNKKKYKWKEKLIDDNLIKSLSQKKIISELFANLVVNNNDFIR